MELIERFSYVLESVALIAVLAVIYARKPSTGMLLVDLSVLGLLLIIWFVLRRTHAAVNPEKKVRKSVGGGRAVLLDFFSNYNSTCLITSLAVIAVQSKHKARVEVISIDMNNPAGRAVAAAYGARTGTLVLIDHRGEEVGRSWWPGHKLIEPVLSRSGR